MDPRLFDEMVRRLSRTLSRRSVTRGSLGVSLLAALGLGDRALARGKKRRKRANPKRRRNTSEKTNRANNGMGIGALRRRLLARLTEIRNRAGLDLGRTSDSEASGSKGGGGSSGKKPATTRGAVQNDNRAFGKRASGRGCTRNGRECGSGAQLQPCAKCCSGYHITTGSRKTRCACKPDGHGCRSSTQCCAGVCDRGVCGALS